MLEKARAAYEREGAYYLIREGWYYVLRNIIPKVLWSILPETTVKKLISRSRSLSTLYFYVRGTFYQEQKSVLNGQIEYIKRERSRQKPAYRIVRNIHRIEKGLSMEDRRKIFAESYIQTTVNDVSYAWKNNGTLEEDQLKWSIDVLNEYFNVVSDTENINKARLEFKELLRNIEYNPNDKVPKDRKEYNKDIPTYNELKDLSVRRTSTRWFKDKKVPRELLDKSLEVAAESPSACNRQSYVFYIYDDDELVNEISDLCLGVTGYEDNIPCLAVIVGKRRAYHHDRDRHIIYIDASLAAMSFQYSLETVGLAACCINWPAIPRNDRAISRKLDLDSDEEVIMMMAIGYPKSTGKIPYSQKKSAKSLREYNKT